MLFTLMLEEIAKQPKKDRNGRSNKKMLWGSIESREMLWAIQESKAKLMLHKCCYPPLSLAVNYHKLAPVFASTLTRNLYR